MSVVYINNELYKEQLADEIKAIENVSKVLAKRSQSLHFLSAEEVINAYGEYDGIYSEYGWYVKDYETLKKAVEKANAILIALNSMGITLSRFTIIDAYTAAFDSIEENSK